MHEKKTVRNDPAGPLRRLGPIVVQTGQQRAMADRNTRSDRNHQHRIRSTSTSGRADHSAKPDHTTRPRKVRRPNAVPHLDYRNPVNHAPAHRRTKAKPPTESQKTTTPNRRRNHGERISRSGRNIDPHRGEHKQQHRPEDPIHKRHRQDKQRNSVRRALARANAATEQFRTQPMR